MMSTLAVQEATGLKVDREAVATLVLPQLYVCLCYSQHQLMEPAPDGQCPWALVSIFLPLEIRRSDMYPVLSLGQFERFMAVIRKLGDRVEKEHNQFLRDSQRLEDRSATSPAANGTTSHPVGGMDFASLVGGASTAGAAAVAAPAANDPSWEDDVWGSLLNDGAQVCGFYGKNGSRGFTILSSQLTQRVLSRLCPLYRRTRHSLCRRLPDKLPCRLLLPSRRRPYDHMANWAQRPFLHRHCAPTRHRGTSPRAAPLHPRSSRHLSSQTTPVVAWVYTPRPRAHHRSRTTTSRFHHPRSPSPHPSPQRRQTIISPSNPPLLQ